MESLKNRTEVLHDFVGSVKRWVRAKYDDYPHKNHGDAFCHWALGLALPELDSDTIYNLQDIAGKDDQGLDAYYRDEQDGVFHIFQSKYADKPKGAEGSPSFGSPTIRELFNAYQLLQHPTAARAISLRFGEIADNLQDSLQKGYELRFSYLLFGWPSSNAGNELNARLSTLDYDNVSSKVYDLDELYSLYLQAEGPQEVDARITIPYYTYCRQTEHQPEAVIANVDLVQLALRTAPYRPAIYSANVRHPLGYNTVNKGVRKTLRDVEDRNLFWHYNNGLTILCNEVVVDEDEQQITFADPSIINGCQTMETAITNLEHLGATDIPIMVRFIKLPNHRTEASDTALKIARFTNSQTQVVAPDLRSNDAIQVEIKMQFEQLIPPWFYERKRGEWNFMRRQDEFDTDLYDRSVKMPDVAQRWYAFCGHPAEAISNKVQLFESDEMYYSVFSTNRTAHHLAVSYLVYERLTELVRQRLEQERSKAEENQSQRIINLSKAMNLSCAQMSALFYCVLCKKYGSLTRDVFRSVLNQLQSSDAEPVGKTFSVLLGCLLSALSEHEQDSAHSVLRRSSTFHVLRDEKLDEQLNIARDTYGSSPLDALSALP